MPPRGFIFDMDGVLVDSEPISDRFTIELVKKLGSTAPIDMEKIRGLSAKPFYSFLIKELKLGISLDELMAQAQPMYMSFWESLLEFTPISGVVELIERLQKFGIMLAVASSAHGARLDFFLDKLGLDAFFPIRISGDDVKNGKPFPDVFLLAAERLHIVPSRCIVVEDTSHGVAAARAAGMKCIGYAGLPHNKQDLSNADIIIKDFSEVSNEVLEKLYA